jgi:hypothetical protein
MIEYFILKTNKLNILKNFRDDINYLIDENEFSLIDDINDAYNDKLYKLDFDLNETDLKELLKTFYIFKKQKTKIKEL